ncbi:NAD(P)-dependent oxidoreductase [Pseudonocardia acaciae]|uniref:NAD(P)-dependent oxidoreductase n=1 Tax=Pseudonocardia acaciae TaxID=551276 RepID=UPI00048A5770|nr:NAD(P)-binding domain-containing protein [Pseudonocardia acaciae]
MANDKISVSVLGLGVMGAALARAFLANGHPTTVWNRTSSRADELVAAGAARAETAASAVAGGDLVILCVVNNAAVRDVLEPVAGELSGRTLVNLTNGSPRQARELAEWTAGHGARYLDGGIMAIPPMIGQPGSTVFYSGDAATFEEHRATLEVLGEARFLGTDAGRAALYDIALLTGMYGVFSGFLQAVSMVRADGIPAAELLPLLMPWLREMLPALEHAAGQIDSGDYGGDVTSPLAMQAAAFENFIETSRDQGVKPDLLVPLRRFMDAAVAAGHGEHDIASLVEVMKL